MAGVGKLLKQAQKMQKKLEALQEEMAKEEIEVSSGGGAVAVRITLAQEFKALRMDPEFLKEDAEFVQDTILEAMKQAVAQSKEQSEARMGEITGGGLGFPGFM